MSYEYGPRFDAIIDSGDFRKPDSTANSIVVIYWHRDHYHKTEPSLR